MKEKYTFYQWCIDNNKNDLLDRWDYDKTGFSPEDITYASAKPVYFKCPNGLHESEKRHVYVITSKSSDQNTFKCKECMKELDIKSDLEGNKFGELTVIKPDYDKTKLKNNGTYWICECSCGNIVSYLGTHLKNGSCTTCGDRKIHRSGENNSNWKGGITPKLLSDRTSKEYKKWRDEVYSRNWYTCQCCGRSNDIEKNAHHIYNFADNEKLKFDLNNSILLCAECHHIKYYGSFHNVYGTHNNTPEQLEEYINSKRKELDINIPFSLESYLAGNILKPGDVFNENVPWIFDVINNKNVKLESNRPKIVA